MRHPEEGRRPSGWDTSFAQSPKGFGKCDQNNFRLSYVAADKFAASRRWLVWKL